MESIFSAPDIQRQLPAEAKMFMQVDKSWKEVMRKVNRLPNALRAATQPGINMSKNNIWTHVHAFTLMHAHTQFHKLTSSAAKEAMEENASIAPYCFSSPIHWTYKAQSTGREEVVWSLSVRGCT